MQRVIDAIADLPGDARGAIFVDLPLAWTLSATAALTTAGYIVVPVVSRWPTASAVLPLAAMQAALVAHAPRAPVAAAGARGVVFLLDGERAAPGHRPIPGKPRNARLFDNRYDYVPCRFPTAEFLRGDAIEAIWWLSVSGIAHDMRTYVTHLAAGGYTPMVVDLDG